MVSETPLFGIYPILDVKPGADIEELLNWALQLADVGVRIVQVRAKGIDEAALPMLLDDLTSMLRGSGLAVIINDYVELVGITGADGVHLGMEDYPVRDARKMLGSKAIVGATCRTAEQAMMAIGQGASYVAAGSVFSSKTKSGPPIIGIDGLSKVVSGVKDTSSNVPVCAIGGITLENINEVKASGAFLVAVIDAVQGTDDPVRAAEELVRMWGK
jgi:thiamine-phosphate pyrophosphorylase